MTRTEAARHVFDMKAKAIIISAILLTAAVCFIPVWQMGVTTSIRYQTAKSQEMIQDLEREDRALKASISEIDRTNFKSELYQIMAGI